MFGDVFLVVVIVVVIIIKLDTAAIYKASAAMAVLVRGRGYCG